MAQGSSQRPAGTSCLDRTQLKVTHVDNFWKAVERTVAVGHPSPAASELPDTLDSGHGNASMQLSNAVIILPRIVTRLHPVHEAPHDHAYQDLMAWDVDFVIQMLQEFLRVSSAQTVPSLEEYRILPDKVYHALAGFAAMNMHALHAPSSMQSVLRVQLRLLTVTLHVVTAPVLFFCEHDFLYPNLTPHPVIYSM